MQPVHNVFFSSALLLATAYLTHKQKFVPLLNGIQQEGLLLATGMITTAEVVQEVFFSSRENCKCEAYYHKKLTSLVIGLGAAYATSKLLEKKWSLPSKESALIGAIGTFTTGITTYFSKAHTWKCQRKLKKQFLNNKPPPPGAHYSIVCLSFFEKLCTPEKLETLSFNQLLWYREVGPKILLSKEQHTKVLNVFYSKLPILELYKWGFINTSYAQ